jgi:hypothetical protein
LLFIVGLGGKLVGVLAFAFKATRRIAPFVLSPLFCAAFLGFWLLWGGGFFAEWIFGPTRWSSFGALFGSLRGLITGGFYGLLFAFWGSRRLSA